MTEKFNVHVRNADMKALEALAAARFIAGGIPQDDQGNVLEHELADEIWVVVRASSPDQAEERVTQALPPGGDYTIERVIPVDEG